MIAPESSDQCPLSPRERDVLILVVEGLSDGEIALRLKISPRTVQSHVSAALRKTGTSSRLQLAVHALRARLVPLDPPATKGEK